MSPAWRRREDVLWRCVGPVLVARPRERTDPAEPLVVTAPGAAVWELLERSRTMDELMEALAEWGDEARVREDLTRLLDGLVAEAAVRVEPGGGP